MRKCFFFSFLYTVKLFNIDLILIVNKHVCSFACLIKNVWPWKSSAAPVFMWILKRFVFVFRIDRWINQQRLTQCVSHAIGFTVALCDFFSIFATSTVAVIDVKQFVCIVVACRHNGHTVTDTMWPNHWLSISNFGNDIYTWHANRWRCPWFTFQMTMSILMVILQRFNFIIRFPLICMRLCLCGKSKKKTNMKTKTKIEIKINIVCDWTYMCRAVQPELLVVLMQLAAETEHRISHNSIRLPRVST